MFTIILSVFSSIRQAFQARAVLQTEILALLHHQPLVLGRSNRGQNGILLLHLRAVAFESLSLSGAGWTAPRSGDLPLHTGRNIFVLCPGYLGERYTRTSTCIVDSAAD